MIKSSKLVSFSFSIPSKTFHSKVRPFLQRMIRERVLLLLIVVSTLVGLSILTDFSFSLVTTVRAKLVSDLPNDNLISNPWFRNQDLVNPRPDKPGLYGWTDKSIEPYCMTTSQKDNNGDPAPDGVVPTAARWGPGIGQGSAGSSKQHCVDKNPNTGGLGGVDGVLYQVVQASDLDKKLKFSFWWVDDNIDHAFVQVYGGDSVDGPWSSEPVWTPWNIVDTPTHPEGVFQYWPEVATTLDQGYDYYKVGITGSHREGTSRGFKFTGVYFATENIGDISSTPIPTDTTPMSGDYDADSDVDILDSVVVTDGFDSYSIFDYNDTVGNFGT